MDSKIYQRTKQLMSQFGSPVYVYCEETISQKAKEMATFAKNLSTRIGVNVKMHYSTKSNGNPAILKLVKQAGVAVDCMSGVELYLDKMAGFAKEDILAVVNNITTEEMKLFHEEGILICFDSISQVEQYGRLFPGSSVMVRINPGTIGVGHSEKVITSGKTTKFGINQERFPQLFEVCKKYELKVVGIHQHLGSLFLDDKIPQYIEGIKAGLEIAKKFPDLRVIDLGGGFGVPYRSGEKALDLNLLSEKLFPILLDFCKDYPKVQEFKFEPGRYIPCEGGFLLGEVTAVEKRGETLWIGTNIGMNTLIRPAMYGSYHEVEILSQVDEKEKVVASICGNICESGDVIGRDYQVIKPQVGDVIVIQNAGAYGYCMASSYTGRLLPAEVMVKKNGEVQTIRKAQTLEDVLNQF